MTQNESSPGSNPSRETQRAKNIDAGVMPEQTFANFGLPFELLQNLSPDGIRVAHPITNPGVNFLLENLYVDGNMHLPDHWELALEAEDEIPEDFWLKMHGDEDGREVVEDILRYEFEYALAIQGINVRIQFGNETIEGREEHFMEVRPYIPEDD